MKRETLRRTASRVAGLLVVAQVLVPRVLPACATCYGNPESPMTQGMNQAILLLLGVVGVLYAGFVKLFWDIRKRGRLLQTQKGQLQPPHGGER